MSKAVLYDIWAVSDVSEVWLGTVVPSTTVVYQLGVDDGENGLSYVGVCVNTGIRRIESNS